MNKGESLVEILLATYNGSKYLIRQIESIFAQTHLNWQILIHDDGSTDDTAAIAHHYAMKYPNKIRIVEDGIKTGGAKNNFAHLMSLSTAKYVAFCDQDDIWLPHKLQISIDTLKSLEKNSGDKIPIGVFTDASIVDAELNLISSSLWQFQGTDISMVDSIRRLSVRNCVTGCTMLINQTALQRSLPIHSNAVMHDWWIALSILKNKGVLCPIKNATVLYRQHFGNAVGAKSNSLHTIFIKVLSPGKTLWQLWQVYKMAKQIEAHDNVISFCAQKAKELIYSGNKKNCRLKC